MEHYWREIEKSLDSLGNSTQDPGKTKRTQSALGALLKAWFIRHLVPPPVAGKLALRTIEEINFRFDEFDHRRNVAHGQFQKWCEDIATGVLEGWESQTPQNQPAAQGPPSDVTEAINIVFGFLSDDDRTLISWLLGRANDATVARSLGVTVPELRQPDTLKRIDAALSRFHDLLEMDPDIGRWIEELDSST